MQISTIIDQISKQLIDTDNVRWTRPEMLDYINMALSAIIIKRPHVSQYTVSVSTDTGKVMMPTEAYMILAVNHADDYSVQYMDIDKLSQLEPAWRKQTGTPTVWTRNEFDNETIFLFPSPSSSISVELVCAKTITITSESESLPIPDIYLPVVFDYVMYRAFGKDSEITSEANKSNAHIIAFSTALDSKFQSDTLKEQIVMSKEKVR